jgi:hypothetical protein
MDKPVAWVVAAATVVIAVAATFVAVRDWRSNAIPALTTSYHAVVLVGGQAFFGRIENLQAENMVLNDVFYVQTRTHPETKQVSNVLVKRGQEAHGPDRMIINRRHVMLIEPVAEGSQVAKLIAEQNKQK